MSNFELENKLLRLWSDMSAKSCEIAAIGCALAGRRESYVNRELVEVLKCIAVMQSQAQHACVHLGRAVLGPEEIDSEVETAMTSPLGVM